MSVSESEADVDGLVIIATPYVCRVCETEREIYVNPRIVDGEPTLVDERHRIVTAPCDSCDDRDRTHVLAYALSRYQPVADVDLDDTWAKPTPPVPPSRIERFDDPGLGSRVLDREREDTACPRCGGTLWLQERQTGERAIGFWEDGFDADRFRLSDEWEVVASEEVCDRCGWNRVLS